MIPRRREGGPDFIIIGAQKSGTTSLYRYLIDHPSVAPAATKQVDFFHVNFGRGADWYVSQFDTGREEGVLTGEASPYCMLHPHAPGRIREFDPRIKLIAILRNPVDRTYSHYHHQVVSGRETLPFEEALSREEERLAGEVARMVADETYYSRSHRRFSYLARSRYVEQLEAWLSLFPRDQLAVLNSEAMFSAPGPTLDRVASFLGLSPWRLERYSRYMPGGYSKSMPEGMRRRLVAHFGPYNERLYRLLGTTFPWDR